MKLGIVGSGIIVKDFLSIAHHLKHTKIVSLCSTKRSEEDARALGKEYLINQIFTDYEDFLRAKWIRYIWDYPIIFIFPMHIRHCWQERM